MFADFIGGNISILADGSIVAGINVASPDVKDRESVLAAMAQFRELGGVEFVKEMIDLLRSQTPEQFRQIDASLASHDLTPAQRHAHSMKSSFGNFGATECRRLATAMDLAAKEGRVADYRNDYQKLREAFAELQPWLDESLG